MNATVPAPAGWRSSRLILLALVLAVVLPGAIAMGLFLTGWRPASLTSHGEFMHPPAQIDTVRVSRSSGETIDLAALRGKWTLLYLMPADCPRACVASLYGMRMAHIGQATEMDRVQRLVVTVDAAQAQDLARRDAGLVAVSAASDQLALLRQRLTMAPADAAPVFLIDPMGNVILRYRQDTDPAGLRKDLTHLIKHSWVG
jgi:cytochrome oxidase Cu insertion factor (SCO1/SenC/PrrC family)